MRIPNRRPTFMDASDGEDSNSRRLMSEDESDYKSIHSLLRETIKLKPDEEIKIYEEEIYEEDLDGDDKNGELMVLQEVDEDEINRIGQENFYSPGDDIISTKPLIRIRKHSHVSLKRLQKLKVPPSSISITLAERFGDIHQSVAKYNITPYFHFINFLRWRQEAGMEKFKSTLETATKYKEHLLSKGEDATSIFGKLAEIIKEEDFASKLAFWQSQYEYWNEQFKWYRTDDREPVSRDQLDKELEEYMAARGFVPIDDKQALDDDMAEYMAKKGYVRETDPDSDASNFSKKPVPMKSKIQLSASALDDELAGYMSKKKNLSVNGSSLATSLLDEPMAEDLDDDIDGYMKRNNLVGSELDVQSIGGRTETDTNLGSDVDTESLDGMLDDYKRKKVHVSKTEVDVDELDAQLDAYMSLR
ncbi:hypothetical protein HDE_09095 [Halotydeus destructor]|nr:hypothetical protein HDE_09095 [Halotydeus destructor]